MGKLFEEAVQTGAGQTSFQLVKNASFRVQPIVEYIALGRASFILPKKTVVMLRLRVLRATREVLDEVTVTVAESPPGSGGSSGLGGLLGIIFEYTIGLTIDTAAGKRFSSGGRLRNCAKRLGAHVADYLAQRSSGSRFEVAEKKER